MRDAFVRTEIFTFIERYNNYAHYIHNLLFNYYSLLLPATKTLHEIVTYARREGNSTVHTTVHVTVPMRTEPKSERVECACVCVFVCVHAFEWLKNTHTRVPP